MTKYFYIMKNGDIVDPKDVTVNDSGIARYRIDVHGGVQTVDSEIIKKMETGKHYFYIKKGLFKDKKIEVTWNIKCTRSTRGEFYDKKGNLYYIEYRDLLDE